MRVCFVCLGNICRSPTAEAVFIRMVREAGLADRVTIDSAGTGDWHVGQLADPRTRSAASKRGLDLTHLARQFTRADFDRFDLVVVMDADNLRNVRRLAAATTAEVVMLRRFDPEAPVDAPIPDPYSGGPEGFEEVLDLCERACTGLLEHVRARL